MDEENAILGKQSIATEGLVPLQLLLGLAMAKVNDTDTDIEELMAVFRRSNIDGDVETAAFLKDATRVRAGITPEGDVGIEAVDEE